LSGSNFCTNCGARLTGKGLRALFRGARCDDCAARLGRRTLKSLALVALIAIAAFALGRYLQKPPPPLIIHRAANSPLPDAPVDFDGLTTANASTANSNAARASLTTDDTVYICGARTRKGTPCRRRVHAAGERCYQHKGMPAMVPIEKLIIKPDAANR
jgi:hypothetical protein